MTISEAAERYLADHPKRNDARRRVITFFVQANGVRPLEEFTKEDAKEWKKTLMGTFGSNNTVRLHLAYVTHLFNWAFECEICQTRPFMHVKRPKAQLRKRYLTPEEYETARATFRRIRPRAQNLAIARRAFVIAVGCAFRRGELLGIKRKHVLLNVGKRGAIYLPKTKNGNDYTVPMDPQTRIAVRTLLAIPGQPNDPLVPLSLDQFCRAWAKVRKAAGLPDVWIHDYRRTKPTWWAHLGASLIDIQELCRHTSPNTTRTNYIHMNFESRERAQERYAMHGTSA